MAVRGPTRQQLQGECKVPPVENSKMLKFYFNGGRQLLVQGEAYYEEGQIEMAYVYLKRFLTLAIDRIPQHTAFKQAKYRQDRTWLQNERQRVLSLLEVISKKIDSADERYARSVGKTTAVAAASIPTSTGGSWLGGIPEAPSQGMSAPTPSAGGNWWENIPEAPTHDASAPKPLPTFVTPVTSHPIARPSVGEVVPSAPPAQEGYGFNGYSVGVYGGGGPGAVTVGFPDGHAYGTGAVSKLESMPLLDAFQSLSLDEGASTVSHYPNVGTPEYQQERPSMRPSHSVLGVKRRLVLPSTLVAEFEKIAKHNTDQPPHGIETCGILAGNLSHNALNMTTLIIPKQEGTPNSCATTDETELFNYMLAKKLITLGWIHTHPKQDCFMSSVDVHTHCGYQLMLPEAVAVVYAPNDNKKRIGVFRLTEPEGMKLIQKCTLKGFHVHPEGVKIYEQADIDWLPVGLKTVDLR